MGKSMTSALVGTKMGRELVRAWDTPLWGCSGPLVRSSLQEGSEVQGSQLGKDRSLGHSCQPVCIHIDRSSGSGSDLGPPAPSTPDLYFAMLTL